MTMFALARPKGITPITAVLYVFWGLGAVRWYGFTPASRTHPWMFVPLAIFAGCYWGFYKGMNWARGVLCVFAGLSLLGLGRVGQVWSASRVDGALLVANAAFCLYLLWYLNTGEAWTWFVWREKAASEEGRMRRFRKGG